VKDILLASITMKIIYLTLTMANKVLPLTDGMELD
jgi:hypothetical protein